MIQTEDDLRSMFDQVAGPDTPPPGFDRLRQRAARRRMRQMGTALGLVVVLAAASIGGLVATSHNSAEPAAGQGMVSHIRVLIPNLNITGWQFADVHAGGHEFRAASYTSPSGECISVTDAGGWCGASSSWDGAAEYETSATNYGAYDDIAGRVPTSARTVTINFNDQQFTTDAVRTPTSDQFRFFFAIVPNNTDGNDPVLAVTDGNGQPVAPVAFAGHSPDPLNATTHSYVTNLPGNQTELSSIEGYSVVAYREGDQVCMAMAQNATMVGKPGCKTDKPNTARVLTQVRIPRAGVFVLGDEPIWSTAILTSQTTFDQTTTLLANLGQLLPDRGFWFVELSGSKAPYRLFTCHQGTNCTTGTTIASPRRLASDESYLAGM